MRENVVSGNVLVEPNITSIAQDVLHASERVLSLSRDIRTNLFGFNEDESCAMLAPTSMHTIIEQALENLVDVEKLLTNINGRVNMPPAKVLSAR